MHRLPPKISSRAPWLAIAAAAGCGFSSSAGAHAGDDAGIIDGASIDAASVDTPPATGCLGPSGLQVCLDSIPPGPVTLPAKLDVDKSGLCLKNLPASWTATQHDACIIAGDTVDIGSVTATGMRPLVIVATSRITVTDLLDVASHQLIGMAGAGSSPMNCQAFARNPAQNPGGGGGAGGSFMFPGADGGSGDVANRQGGQPSAPNIGAPTQLRGGCPGQVGGGGKPGDAGGGGGAVYLVSAGAIEIPGKINASGAGGGGGNGQVGGSGGGSGGMIVLYGFPITTTTATLLIANGGGGGGGGAAVATRGVDGQDPSTLAVAPAPGGGGGILVPGTGGDGGNGFAAPVGSVAFATAGGSGEALAGGGGGGGGGGYIQSNHGLGGAVVSPAVTLKP